MSDHIRPFPTPVKDFSLSCSPPHLTDLEVCFPLENVTQEWWTVLSDTAGKTVFSASSPTLVDWLGIQEMSSDHEGISGCACERRIYCLARKLGRDNALISSIRPWKADFGYSSSGHESHPSRTNHGKLAGERWEKTKEVEKWCAHCFDKWRWSSLIIILCMTFSPEESSVVSITFSSRADSVFNGCRLMHVEKRLALKDLNDAFVAFWPDGLHLIM